MKVRHALIVFFLGFMLHLIGSLFKIMHWPGAGVLLIAATAVQVAAVAVILYKLFRHRKFQDFLDR